MARISTYNIDQDVRADDKVIGTDSNGSITKNFTPAGIATFLNNSGSIAIAGQNNFFFQTDLAGGRKAGTISFTAGDGENTLFNVLTTIKVSKYASSTTMVLDYLQTLVNQVIFIGQLDDLNSFGIYKLVSLTQDLLEPDFYNATLQELESNGTLLKDKYYALAAYPYIYGLVPTSRTLTINGTTYDLSADRTWNVGTVTSVGLSMPSAFAVANSPITVAGTIAVTGAGVASQYVRGDGTLANFPAQSGGGASVSYYLNGSVSQGTILGNAYKEINGTPINGAGTDFTISADGYIAQFITDPGDPNKLSIPAGNWNFETYFSASSSGGSPQFYIELYKYNGTAFTLIATNSATPENITGGTNIDLYFTALAVPQTTLTITDRLAVRFYVIHSGRTITMHTENSHLSQIITTFSSGLSALNGLTSQTQYFAVGTSGNDFNIVSATDTHTFNLPDASAIARGVITTGAQSFGGSKTFVNDILVNQVTVGKGTGNLSGNVILGLQPFQLNSSGTFNVAIGYQPLYYNTTGSSNVAIGALALNKNTTGTANVATGVNALGNNTTGSTNTANGDAALYNNTTGIQNVAIGRAALFSSATVDNNIAVGYYALSLSTATLAPNSAVGTEAMKNNTAGWANTAMGYQAMFSNTTGWVNTAMGSLALYTNTTGTNNVGLGSNSLYSNTTGIENTAVGTASLRGNTTGNRNVGIGFQTMYQVSTGDNNIAVGHTALTNNNSGSQNVALGMSALLFNTTGSDNTAVGYRASWSNTTSSYNTSVGRFSLYSNTTGTSNTAAGASALSSITTGSFNVGIGVNSMSNSTTGSNNVAIGNSAIQGTFGASNIGYNNVGIGYWGLRNNTSGYENIGIGYNSLLLNPTDNNSIVIGSGTTGLGSNTVTLGNTSITTTRLRGAVQGGSFVKDGGTSAQYLMADGSVTIAPYKYNFSGSLTLTGTLTTTNLLTITIPANSLTDYLDIRSIMVQQSGPALAGMQVRVWHNSVNNFNTATRIANYAFGGGGADLFAQMTRKFSLQSGLLFGSPSIPSSATGEGSNTNPALSLPFDTTVVNYLFVSIQLNNVLDTAILRNVNIIT